MVGNSTDIATCAFVAALNIPSRGYKCLGSSLERASPTEDPILDRKNPCTCPKFIELEGENEYKEGKK